jgi:APA family basic amino acid/polyamine antiporter
MPAPAADVKVGEGEKETEGDSGKLVRELNALDLTALGVGGIVGAGIFVVSGEAAYKYAGPAVILSFALSGACAAVYALCFAELAAMFVSGGSAYSYAKNAFGNATGFVVGWCLLAEYLFSVSAVSVGWAGYFTGFLASLGLQLPTAISAGPFSFDEAAQRIVINSECWINLPAVLLVLLVMGIICVGAKKSITVITVMVGIKLVIIFIFLAFGIWFVKAENLTPFIPEETSFGHFGWSGIIRGASVVFFAYIGFDGVTAAAAETEDPATMMPISILASLGISTVLYMLVAFVMVGLAPYTLLGERTSQIDSFKFGNL